jgi:hypothetical protein
MNALALSRVVDLVLPNGAPAPMVVIQLNCGHQTLWRRSFLAPVIFGEVLLCHACLLTRDV